MGPYRLDKTLGKGQTGNRLNPVGVTVSDGAGGGSECSNPGSRPYHVALFYRIAKRLTFCSQGCSSMPMNMVALPLICNRYQRYTSNYGCIK